VSGPAGPPCRADRPGLLEAAHRPAALVIAVSRHGWIGTAGSPPGTPLALLAQELGGPVFASPAGSGRPGRNWRGRYAVQPLHATPRNPDRISQGPLVGVIADALGTPLMPWQAQVADVAGEVNPDGSMAYPLVVVSVPRQSGKTTLIRARAVTRCVTQARQGVFYTAQTGKDARERWRDLTKQITASALRSVATIRQGTGAERIIFPNLSEFRVFAPVPTALHGYTPHEVYLTRPGLGAPRGADGAIGPDHREDRQLWIVSTAGPGLRCSAVLVGCRAGGHPGVACFIWAAAEAGPVRPGHWHVCGLGLPSPSGTYRRLHPAHPGRVRAGAATAGPARPRPLSRPGLGGPGRGPSHPAGRCPLWPRPGQRALCRRHPAAGCPGRWSP
jgi:hypothetical protein